MKKQLKIMQQEKAAKSSKRFNKNVAHLQYAIVQSKEQNSDTKAASEVKKAAGDSKVYKATKTVASQIKTLSTALASKNGLNSFVELQEGQAGKLSKNSLRSRNLQFLESKRSMRLRKASLGDKIKSGVKKGVEHAKKKAKTKLKELWSKAKCAIAQKLPFGLDKKMAKKFCPPPPKNSEPDKPDKKPPTKPTKPNKPGDKPPAGAASDEMCVMCVYIMERMEREVGFPGKDLSGSNEGYSSNGEATYPGPAAYAISDNGLGTSSTEALPANSPLPGPGYSSGMFLETGERIGAQTQQKTKQHMRTRSPVDPSQDFKDYETLVPNKVNLEQRLKNDYNMEPRERLLKVKETEMLETARNSMADNGMGHVTFIDTAKVPKDEVGTGKPIQDSPRLSAMSQESDMSQIAEKGTFIETSEGKSVSSAASVASHCPDGMPYCRKPLKRLGRRGLIREQDRNNQQLQFANAYTDMDKACKGMLQDFPSKYSKYVQSVQMNLPQVAKEYMHDYSNEEICVDIGMCVQKQVRVQPTKIDYRL